MRYLTSGKIWYKVSKENQQLKPFSSSDTQSFLSPSRYDLQLTRQLKSVASVLWWIKSKEFTVYAHKLRHNKRMHHGCSGRDTSFHWTEGMVTPEQPIGQQLADREKKLSISGEWLSYYTDSMQALILCHSKKINDGIYALWCCITWRLMTEISPSGLHWASIVNSLIWG